MRFSGLRAHMTISYVWVTVVSVLLLELLVIVILGVATYASLATPLLEPVVRQDAVLYALEAASETRGEVLSMQATFQPHRAGSLIFPQDSPDQANSPMIEYIATRYPDTQPESFAMLIARDGQIVASSYPRRYPAHTAVWGLLTDRTKGVANALAGSIWSATSSTVAGRVAYAAAPVWSRDGKPIGAIYVEIPGALPRAAISDLWVPLRIPLISSLVLLLITAPIGGLFGAISTRGLVRRIGILATATTQFTDGNYEQKVYVGGNDEVGLLETQFNRMAEQLLEHISERQALAEQNARLAERNRISRELHDALSQDLFSLHMLAGGLQAAIPQDSPLYAPITALKQSAQTMILEMRALLLELRPTQLEHMGLPAALEDVAAAYRSRLGIEVTTKIETVALSGHIEHAILRIAQEALSNAARHADATVITLALQSQEATVTLAIEDNGQGFEPTLDEQEQHGMGLYTMQERTRELHGTFELKSAPGQGTHIHINLPREEEHDSSSHH